MVLFFLIPSPHNNHSIHLILFDFNKKFEFNYNFAFVLNFFFDVSKGARVETVQLTIYKTSTSVIAVKTWKVA